MKALRKVKLHPGLKFKVLLKKIASAVSLTSLNPLKKLNGSRNIFNTFRPLHQIYF